MPSRAACLAATAAVLAAPTAATAVSDFEGFVEGAIGIHNASVDEDYFESGSLAESGDFDVEGFNGSVGIGGSAALTDAWRAAATAFYEINAGQERVFADVTETTSEIENVEFNDGYGLRLTVTRILNDNGARVGGYLAAGEVEFCKEKAFDFGSGPGRIEDCDDAAFTELGVELGRRTPNGLFDGFVRAGWRLYDDFDTSFEPDFAETHAFDADALVIQIGARRVFGAAQPELLGAR